MNKFTYAFIVIAFGFLSLAGVSSLSTPVVVIAEDSYESSVVSDTSSVEETDTEESQEEDTNDGQESDSNDESSEEENSEESVDENDTDSVEETDTEESEDSNGHESQSLRSYGGGHNPTPKTSTVVAKKIVCEKESDLPNWGNGGPTITATTATAYVAANKDCKIVDWTFEWAPNTTKNPGDHKKVAGGAWTPFSGSTTVPTGSWIWVREQFNTDYIPFTGDLEAPRNNVSAELYCDTDVLNFDNYDSLDPIKAGNTYHCVGFNVLKTPPTPKTATIVATKIVCESEADLPNWGNGGPNITSTTAATFLAENPDCHTTNWTFEWAPNGTKNPGDHKKVAGGAWTPFSGTTTVPTGNLIWVREQFNTDYIPFSGDLEAPRDNVSAELYCNTDVLNYDNFDWIDPVQAGKTYNCIGFNVLKEEVEEDENNDPIADAGDDQIITLPTNSVTIDASGSSDSDGSIVSYVWDFVSGPSTINPNDVVTTSVTGLVQGTYVFKLTVTDNEGATAEDLLTITVNPAVVGHTPQCSDGVDNNDTEDTLVDSADPGCHTDGNPTNTGSYNPNDNNETDVPKCSNTGDDDADNLIDALDPGCHTDGDAGNPTSYDPNDNDETNGGNGGGDKPQCSDGVDNNDPEDTLVDSADPGCHTDGDAGNGETYNPNDNNETNEDGTGGGDLPQCSDSVDNDGDGDIDHPADSGCDDSQDDNEDNARNRRGGGSRRTGQVLAVSNTCGIYVDKYLRVGHANNPETVKKVQTFLNDYMKSGLVVDGIYGTKTEAAVKSFQVKHAEKVLKPWNINQPTGIFYLTTQTEVNNIMCPTLNLPIPSNLINFSQNRGVTPAPIYNVASVSNSVIAPTTSTGVSI